MRSQAGKGLDLLPRQSGKKTRQTDLTHRLCGENRIDENIQENCTDGLITAKPKKNAMTVKTEDERSKSIDKFLLRESISTNAPEGDR